MFPGALVLAALAGLVVGKVQYLGVAIAGIDFGCDIDGSCPLDQVQLPLSKLGGADGAGQMKHFVDDDQMNMFRLPTSWQFLVNNQLGGNLDSTNLDKYDQLMQACLSTGAYCLLDLHNFAHYDGKIIGQGGPTNDQFADLWTQLATKYAKNDKVVFQLMNEPHDLDMGLWAKTCQAAITAIRKAGATKQMILLPGTNFDSAGTLVSDGSAALLMNLTNPDGTTDGLILDVHKYLDINNSGTHKECVFDNVDAFKSVADYLRQVGRKGIVSETGASSDASCMTDFCTQNEFINANSDVLIGLVAWGAGSFKTDYVLSLTPTQSNGKWTDNKLTSQCVIAPWVNSQDDSTSSSSSGSPSSTSSGMVSKSMTASTTTISASISASASSSATASVSLGVNTGAAASESGTASSSNSAATSLLSTSLSWTGVTLSTISSCIAAALLLV